MHYNLDWLKKRVEDGETVKYLHFWGHSNNSADEVGKFIFSQWYPSVFTVDGITYKTAEHWMMAQKSLLFNDVDIFNKILKADKPGEVKALGRKILDFDQVIWDRNKFEIVVKGSFHKFSQHEKLRQYLLDTQDRVIVEASPVDVIWGVGLSQDSTMINSPHDWKGENLLGFALMAVRDQLRNTPFVNAYPKKG